jgi:hypothetical protein
VLDPKIGVARLTVHCVNLARWFGAEFLRIPMRFGVVPVLTAISRLSGIAVTGAALYLQLRGTYQLTGYVYLTQWCLAIPLALLVGNVAKECGFILAERTAAALGLDFDRRGYTLDGRRFRKTLYPDGSWTRCETSARGTVCEWTDPFGRCEKVVTSFGRREKP